MSDFPDHLPPRIAMDLLRKVLESHIKLCDLVKSNVAHAGLDARADQVREEAAEILHELNTYDRDLD